MPDYGSISNSLGGPNPSSTPGVISFDIEWQGRMNRISISDPAEPFRAEVIENAASIGWTATTKGVTYVSDRPDPATSLFAEIGHEQNGTFFNED